MIDWLIDPYKDILTYCFPLCFLQINLRTYTQRASQVLPQIVLVSCFLQCNFLGSWSKFYIDWNRQWISRLSWKAEYPPWARNEAVPLKSCLEKLPCDRLPQATRNSHWVLSTEHSFSGSSLHSSLLNLPAIRALNECFCFCSSIPNLIIPHYFILCRFLFSKR